MSDPKKPDISVVIPAWNEADNLERLRDGLIDSLESLGKSFEILFIDDGSTDGTFEEIAAFAKEDARIRGVRMRKNMGKSNALAAGFELAAGAVVVTLDADNQDDPAELPRFLDKLEEGYDLVSGWKKTRNDPPSRVRASRLFNWVIRKISGIPLHDFNCGFKAYRAEVIKEISLYGEWHRFIPVMAADRGFRVGEVEVRHRARTHGKSRYGFERYFRGFADCLSLLVLSRYAERPGHLFMGVGFSCIGLGILLQIVSMNVSWHPEYPGLIRFLFYLFSFFSGLQTVGVISVFFGLLAEMLVANNPPKRYRVAIAEKVGF
jgi:glycosyltransferase involved in cell wall biosynthesis